MSDTPAKFRWLQFGMKSLLVMMLLTAVVLSFAQQRQYAAQAAALKDRNRELEEEMRGYEEAFKYHVALRDLYSALDLSKEEHREVYQSVQIVVDYAFAAPVKRRRVKDAHRETEVIVFERFDPQYGFVAVLLVDQGFVDVLERIQGREAGWKQQGDGTICLTYTADDRMPTRAELNHGGGIGFGWPRSQEHVFAITETGFKRVGGRPMSGLLGN